MTSKIKIENSTIVDSPIKVELLIDNTEIRSVIRKVACACYICTHSNIDNFNQYTLEECKGLINRVLDMGHLSVLRHANFTFLISGVSRSMTHQLVRHTAGVGISQQSMRYTKLSNDNENFYAIPDSITESSHFDKYKETISSLKKFYLEMVKNGIPAEDARFILPIATKSNIMFTANAQSLHNFFKARICSRAQDEIRTTALIMKKLIISKIPCLFNNAGSNCKNCMNPCESRNIFIK